VTVRRAVSVVAVLAAVPAGFVVFVLAAMRTRSPRMLRAVRRFNKAFMNKLQRRSAGTPGAYASLLRHHGRTSGRTYETPIVPFAADDGFVIALPYGTDTDWLKNVRASGSAELVTGGHTYTVERPEIIAVGAMKDVFPATERRTHRLFGVEQCVRLHRVTGTSE
jgi:deazaflavin-dependent oxidoreductase (nitroreductase family)